MKTKKLLGLLLAATMVVGMLSGCGNKDNNNPSDGDDLHQTGELPSENGEQATDESNVGTEKDIPFYLTLDPEISGELDIMTWSGDSVYHADLGHWEPSVEEDLTANNVAMIYAMAKKFNEMYPNLKINLYAKSGSHNSNNTSWSQEMENFKAEHGKYPDIYASVDLPSDVSKGLAADLSVYADDPMYRSFIPSIMEMMNYYGVQAGLPKYVTPWGVFVNKELAEINNIDVPDPDWTIDDYTDFVTSADNVNFWGLINSIAITKFIGSGTDTVNYAILEGKEVDLASEQVMNLLEYIPQWASTEVWTRYNAGAIPEEIMNDMNRASWRAFCKNYILVDAGDPWNLTQAVVPQNADGTWPQGSVQSGDWDVYPRPSTAYRGNSVAIQLDPMAIYNYAMEDGDPALNEAEKAKLDIAYAFGSYWCGATEAMQARADQMYNASGTLKTSINDCFPVVTGEEFDKQMEIWYSAGRERYADADLMPGFQYVLELWQEGVISDFSDKCYPSKIMVDGSEVNCLYEWNNLANAAVTGVGGTDPSWLDTVKSNLADWSENTRERFAQALKTMQDGLKTYYGLSDSDF